jgi:hypothetical protein
MNAEVMSLGKQFHLGVLSSGNFTARQGLSNEEYLLEMLRAEAQARDKKAESERVKQARLLHTRGSKNLTLTFRKALHASSLTLLQSSNGLTPCTILYS